MTEFSIAMICWATAVCTIFTGATVVMVRGKEGWGWLVFAGILVIGAKISVAGN